MIMTPCERVMTALQGGCPDKVPFTVYECMIPQCAMERELRNRGLCIVHRMPTYKLVYPNVNKKSYSYVDDKGRSVVRTTYTTPYGELTQLEEPAGFTRWTHEHIFKTPDDYKALEFMFKDCAVVTDYENVQKKVACLGEDFVVRDQLPSEPLQQLISHYMGAETFCYEWADNRDEIFKLYDALVETARKTYPIVANGPLKFANLGGNVVPQIIGADNFNKHFVPHYNEAAEVLHEKGKLIGCHFDADNTTIMDAIGQTALDYIEAYDAGISPSVGEARKAWPDKVLWINWPSSWHLNEPKTVRELTLKLMEEAAPGNGFLIGITEDVPEDRWQSNYKAIVDGIDDFYDKRVI